MFCNVVQAMPLKIVFDDDSFYTLKRSVPPHSQSAEVLKAAVHFGVSRVAITCSEPEARALLLYAEHSPKLVASIQAALRSGNAPGPS